MESKTIEINKMEKIIIVIEKSKDHFGAYSENCDGIYAAGSSIDDVKAEK